MGPLISLIAIVGLATLYVLLSYSLLRIFRKASMIYLFAVLAGGAVGACMVILVDVIFFAGETLTSTYEVSAFLLCVMSLPIISSIAGVLIVDKRFRRRLN